jgi:predicted  nucleic acid-binding Zn-ribbon protein
MSRRYNEFRLELIEDHTTLAQAERHASELKTEIEKEKARRESMNLRLSYALDELEATQDYIRDIKKQMAMEEAWSK